ncbi:MAG: cobalt transporter CbiM [Deltaproteobacteria bacterium]|jgi:cobalt/nickel transport system permease protein|nr:cobalt transporter CbiM [Deltaproteobacteria bacterium]
MHISEGILSAPVLIGGTLITLVGAGIGFKKIDADQLPKAGVLSASFFVASLIHVPVGAASIHLTLNGLIGILLGWGAIPVILVALLLQAVLFQFGGITTLGVNTIIMAFPAVILYLILKHSLITQNRRKQSVIAFIFGFMAALLSTLLMILSLYFTSDAFNEISSILLAINIPILFIEGIITAFCITFISEVKPDLLLNH